MKLYSNITIFFLIWVLSILIISYFGFSILPSSSIFPHDFIKNLANWDGNYYLSISQNGYQDDTHYAFFPLYPLLIKALSLVLQNYLFSAVIISISATFLGIKLLYNLINQQFDKKIAKKSILALLIFPTSFYFLIAYSEGLFFFLTIATFYFARKNLFLAVIFSVLATATRLPGLAVAFALILQTYQNYGINRKNWFVILSPLGFIIYCGYLYIQTGDPIYFLQSQQNWQRLPNLPYLSFWQNIQQLVTPGFIEKYPNFLLDLFFSIFGVGMIIRSFRFLPFSYSVYGFLSILFPLLTSTLMSMPRFLLPIFPIYIMIALWKNENASFAYQLLSIMLLSLFVILFINGFWVS